MHLDGPAQAHYLRLTKLLSSKGFRWSQSQQGWVTDGGGITDEALIDLIVRFPSFVTPVALALEAGAVGFDVCVSALAEGGVQAQMRPRFGKVKV